MFRSTRSWLGAGVAALLLGACGPVGVPGGPNAPGGVKPLGEYQEGLITYYDANGMGNCSFDRLPASELYVAALTKAQYGQAEYCGTCAEIEGPKGRVTVRIVDSCPDCEPVGHLDLSPQAFEKVADLVAGRVKVKWRLVQCAVQGPLQYRFKEGSSQYWTAIQVRNHRLPLAKLEYWKNGAWVEVKREDYNYFVEPKGLGTGEVRVRVTASSGQQLEDTLPGVQPGGTFQGKAQFDG